jgi:hypothetical protein
LAGPSRSVRGRGEACVLLGLGTIIEVLRFQEIHIRELAGEAVAS